MNDLSNQLVGWELSNPDPTLFNLDVMGEDGEFVRVGETGTYEPLPEQTLRRLTPIDGKLILLDRDRSAEGDPRSYYAGLIGGKVRFLLFSEPAGRWASARCIGFEDVPGYSLRDVNELLESARADAARAIG